MKAIFIAFDQAHYEALLETLEKRACRGFSAWNLFGSRGSSTGDPHYGSHAWPAESQGMMVFVPDDRCQSILDDLKALDDSKPLLGLRAWSWSVDQMK